MPPKRVRRGGNEGRGVVLLRLGRREHGGLRERSPSGEKQRGEREVGSEQGAAHGRSGGQSNAGGEA